jgi:hypothetical protein
LLPPPALRQPPLELKSLAPLLLIAALCIVAGGPHWRHSFSSLRSASSPARVMLD